MNDSVKKKLIFVSTGRCGTKRLAEILTKNLGSSNYSVEHQTSVSRYANVIGNIMFRFKSSEKIKERIFNNLLNKYAKTPNFISTDPLVSMILPDSLITSKKCKIVYVYRDNEGFSNSFFKLSRKRFFSFIAHNFIPFWQPYLWPLENLFEKRVKKKYMKINEKKRTFFLEHYRKNSEFEEVSFDELYLPDRISRLINEYFNDAINIPKQELEVKSN